jgi:hypothetical protein
MAHYIGYFIEDGRQAWALGAVGLVWLGFTALGTAAGGRNRLREVDHLIGWALLSLLFTLTGVFAKLPFTWLTLIAAIAAVTAGVYALRRDRSLLAPGLGRVLLLGLPFLVLAAAMQGSQWDEFTDWLVIPRYMLESDAFPSRANPFTAASFAGYPYSWHFVGYLAGRIAGGLVESAGALSNVLLLFGFALLVARLVLIGAGRHPEGERPGWALLAASMLAVTLVNPTFAQKIVLTAYAETATAIATATAMILLWMVLDALAAREFDRAGRLAWRVGLVLALLINLKQATLVLAVIVVLAALFMALRDRAVPTMRFLRLLPAIMLPAAVIFATWRYHLAQELTMRELALQPLQKWLVGLIPQILAKMLIVLAKKGYYLALALVLLGCGVVGFWRARSSFDRLAALAALVFLGYNAFLLFAYVTTFGRFDALRTASYWRYNMHLGGIVVAFAAYAAAVLWRTRLADKVRPQRLAWLPVILIVAAPFVFASKLRFDREPMTRHFREIGAAVAQLVRPGDRIYNVDPRGSGESSAALTYELRERAVYTGQISAFSPDRVKTLRDALAANKINALLVYSLVAGFEDVLGIRLDPSRTYLLRRADGAWRVVASWPKPKSD